MSAFEIGWDAKFGKKVAEKTKQQNTFEENTKTA